MNLHSIACKAVGVINKGQTFYRFRSAGYETNASGDRVQIYEEPIIVDAQVQQPSGMSDQSSNGITTATVIRKFWVFAHKSEAVCSWSLSRPLARSGDYLRDGFGNFWLVTSVEEDFSNEGWVSLLATMTTDAPNAVKEYPIGC